MRFKILVLVIMALTSYLPSYADYEEAKAKIKYSKALEAGCDKIVVKDAKLASGLSFLPGGGSFYTGAPGMGVLGLLLWPWSVVWEIPSSSLRAHTRNEIATVLNCEEQGKIK